MRKVLFFALLAFCVCSCCSTAQKEDPKPKDLIIIGHRGAASLAPENTLAAFEAGIQAGADMVEIDIHLSLDDTLVVCHDDSINRTTNSEGDISSMTWAQLSAVNIVDRDGNVTDLKLPTMRQVFDLVGDRAGILIEIKKTEHTREGIEQACIDLVREYKAEKNIIIQSFDDEVLFKAHDIAPDLRYEKLISNPKDSFDFSRYDFCPSINIDHRYLRRSFAKAAKAAGKEVKIWGLEHYWSDMLMLVDGVITDDPTTFTKPASRSVNVQAHRGGMGLMPENTIAAMINAIDLGVNTLEMDMQISADGQVVVSHDAYFHHRYATRPDGSAVKKGEPKEYIYSMPYSEIAKYDVGLKENSDWPEKECIAAVKPLMSELIDAVEKYVKDNNLPLPSYNIEVKSSDEEGEGVNWPEYKEFSDKCIALLKSKNLGDRLVVQCFDARALNYMHSKYPEFHYSYLTRDYDTEWEKFMGLLDFTPEWWSPSHDVVNEDLVAKAHAAGMKIVPWTVDDRNEMCRLMDLGCEAIISNYPNRIIDVCHDEFE